MHVHMPRLKWSTSQSSVWEGGTDDDFRPLVQSGRRISSQIYDDARLLALQSTTFQLSDQIMLKVTSPGCLLGSNIYDTN